MYVKVGYPDRQCEHCKQCFTPNRVDKRFCKNSCKKKASGLRTGRTKRYRENYRLKYGPAESWQSKIKKNFCECCGFIAVHRCQLDVDHINGVHDDNRPENLQTLCANCHRLKTWMNRDWENKKDEPNN